MFGGWSVAGGSFRGSVSSGGAATRRHRGRSRGRARERPRPDSRSSPEWRTRRRSRNPAPRRPHRRRTLPLQVAAVPAARATPAGTTNRPPGSRIRSLERRDPIDAGGQVRGPPAQAAERSRAARATRRGNTASAGPTAHQRGNTSRHNSHSRARRSPRRLAAAATSSTRPCGGADAVQRRANRRARRTTRARDTNVPLIHAASNITSGRHPTRYARNG